VKPSQAAKVLEMLRKSGISKDTLVISIMAGLTIADLESMLGTENPLVRGDAEHAVYRA